MPISAETRPRQGGFTLLEIMATVAVVALFVLPVLQVRQQSNARAYRASRMLTAMHYAEQLVVHSVFTTETYDRYQSTVEEDNNYIYELTLEEYDLSTGLTADEAEEQEAESDFESDDPLFSGPVPGDAGVPPEDEEERDSFHRVRRFRIRVSWPSWEGEDEDSFEHVDLEGYLPRAYDREEKVDS